MRDYVPELILNSLRIKGNKAAKEAAGVAIENKRGIDDLNHAASSKEKKLKNAAIKTLRYISEDAPELTYDFIHYYDYLLDSDDQILKWNAIFIITNHAAIDKKNKIDEKIVDRLIDLLNDKVLITAANAASCIWKIAKYKPQYRTKIEKALIKIDLKERNQECREILSGKAILSLEEIWDNVEDKKKALKFVKRHIKSQRKATRKKAEKFLKKHNKSGVPLLE